MNILLEIFNTYWHYWLIYTISTWIAFFVLFGFAQRVKDPKSKWYFKLFGGLFVVFLDWPCNIFLSGIPFFDLPGKWDELVTGRLKRYKRKPAMVFGEGNTKIVTKIDWYRYDLAVWLCNQLDRGDEGHC